jgi:hypothetical protein
MCILETGYPYQEVKLTGQQTWMRASRRAKPNGFAVVLVCLALLALLAVVQVAHVHSIGTDADHCPLCVVMHSAAPIAVAAAVIVLVQINAPAPELQVRAASRPWLRDLFIRPPPALCEASFRIPASA